MAEIQVLLEVEVQVVLVVQELILTTTLLILLLREQVEMEKM